MGGRTFRRARMKSAVTSCVCAGALVLTALPASASEPSLTPDLELTRAAATVESLTGTDSLLNVNIGDSRADVVVPTALDEPVTIGGGAVDVGVLLPGDGDAEPQIHGEGTVVYENDDQKFHTLLQVLESPDPSLLADGARAIVAIEGPSAPREYRFEVDLPAGARLALQSDGSVHGVSSRGQILLVVPKPWAYDSDGTPVDTGYRVKGTELIQTVDFTAEHAFPVMADPVWFVPLVIAGGRILGQIAVSAATRAAAVKVAAVTVARMVIAQAVRGVTVAKLRNCGIAALAWAAPTAVHTVHVNKMGDGSYQVNAGEGWRWVGASTVACAIGYHL
jgi:hypothetical protein